MKKAMAVVKVTSALLLTTLLFANNMNVQANNNQLGAKYGDVSTYSSPEEQLAKILNNPNFSKIKKDMAYRKYLRGRRILNGEISRPKSIGYGTKILNVPWCKQTEKHYCGPASVQQVVKYLNGYSDSQDEIARELRTHEDYGTDIGRIVDYLNVHTDKTYESLWTIRRMKIEDFENLVVDSIAVREQPIIAHINMENTKYSNSEQLPFYTIGHYVVIDGYLDGGRTIHITDPYAHKATHDGEKFADGKYNITSSVAQGVIDRIVW